METAATITSFAAALADGGVESIDHDQLKPVRAEIIFYLLTDDPKLSAKRAGLEALLNNLHHLHPEAPPRISQEEVIQEEDWGKKWKESFKTFHLTNRLVIKPSWEEYTAQGDEIIIEMDPGMAYGTGLHASTRMAWELTEQYFSELQTSPQVLDVGTGTGILAISSALFGATAVLAVDNDPDAVEAARNNIKANLLSDKIKVSGTDLADIDGKFDLIIANIIHDTIITLAPELSRRLKDQGALVLSGILAGPQAQNIKERFRALGLTQVNQKNSEEWEAITFQKIK